jgi:octaprenyl-diphosphate synthase
MDGRGEIIRIFAAKKSFAMLSIITQSVGKELAAFDRLYREALLPSVGDFRSMLDFVSARTGKRIRPLLVMLSAKLCGEVGDDTLRYAVVLELLHTATLIHDDVVDNTRERRGRPSVMAQFDNRRAVLLGDYLLSQAIVRGVATANLQVLGILAGVAQHLAEGELSQLMASSEVPVDEERYFEVIRKKTATLLASCAELGALSAGAGAEQRERLRRIGNGLGLCFQLKDDIFDYFEQGALGKPTGNDIREGKVSLPLIYALQTAPEERAAPLLAVLRRGDLSPESVRRLIEFAKEYRGVDYAYRRMQELKAENLALLELFPPSEARTALMQLADYIVERER